MHPPETAAVLVFLLACLVLPGHASGTATDNDGSPRVVIVMIADGWGYRHVAASGMYRHGAAGTLCYERFPVQLAMSTYPAGGRYDPELMWADADWCMSGATDSAASATAMASGVKTDNRVVGQDPAGRRLRTVVEAAAQHGMRTGLVTSVPFSHATPACYASHVQSRSEYNEISRQMLSDSPLDLIMGCGHPWYDKAGNRRSEPDFKYISEEDWLALLAGDLGNDNDGDGTTDNWQLITEQQEFSRLALSGSTERIFGLPRVWSTLQESRPGSSSRPYGTPLTDGLPDLAGMSLGALNSLAMQGDGFLLMIEGGAVDWAGHGRDEVRLIEEMQDFNYAVDCVSSWIENGPGWDDALLIVTGDHECGYLCGPGEDRLHDPIVNNGAGILPGMEFKHNHHTNQLIPFFARGYGAELFNALADETDPVHGRYLDNAELGQFLIRIVESR